MKRRDPRPGERGAEQRLDASTHFLRRLIRERDGKNFILLRVAFRQQVGNPLRDHAGFARAGSGKYQKRAVDMKNSIALLGI
jgi:hypothetical protein